MTATTARDDSDPSTGELVSQLSSQVSRLVRDELKLAQLETGRKAKKMGMGAGLFGGAGLVAVYALGAFVAAAILGLAHAVTPWLAAAIVGAALLLVAGIVALAGKQSVGAGTPPLPEEALDGIKQDVQTVKEHSHR